MLKHSEFSALNYSEILLSIHGYYKGLRCFKYLLFNLILKLCYDSKNYLSLELGNLTPIYFIMPTQHNMIPRIHLFAQALRGSGQLLFLLVGQMSSPLPCLRWQ